MQSALGAQCHAGSVVGVSLELHDALDLAELTADFHDDGLSSLLDGAHGHSGEDEGQHSADEQADQNGGAGQGEVQNFGGAVLDDVDVGDQQSQSGQGCRADGEALTGSSGGVAQGVQSVGTLTDLFRQTGHFCDTAGVVSNGAVCVGSQGDAQGGQHADSSDADAVQALVEGCGEVAGLIHDGDGAACCEVSDQDSCSNDQDGSQGGHQAQGDTTDDDGSSTGLGGSSQVLGGLVVVRGEVLGEVADQAAAHQTAEDGDVDADPALADDEHGQGSCQNSRQDSGRVCAGTQRGQQGQLGSVFLGLDQEGTQDGADDAHNSQSHGQQHALPAVAGACAQGEGSQDGADIGLVQVSTHTGDVADVVAHVVSDGSGVTGVIFRDACLDLTNQVGTHVSSLGVDTAADTCKQCHEGCADAVHNDDVAQDNRIGDAGCEAQDGEPHGDVQHAQANDGEAHNGAGGECNAQAAVQALGSSLCGTCVGVGGDLHADETGQHGEDTTGQEGEGGELRQHLTAGGECHSQQDHEDHCEDLGDGGVLVLQICVGTLADGASNLLHGGIALRVGHYLVALDQGEDQSQGGADKADP